MEVENIKKGVVVPFRKQYHIHIMPAEAPIGLEIGV